MKKRKLLKKINNYKKETALNLRVSFFILLEKQIKNSYAIFYLKSRLVINFFTRSQNFVLVNNRKYNFYF